jgi:hypothetical protein
MRIFGNRCKRVKNIIVGALKNQGYLISIFLGTTKEMGLRVALRQTYGWVLLSIKKLLSLSYRGGFLVLRSERCNCRIRLICYLEALLSMVLLQGYA